MDPILGIIDDALKRKGLSDSAASKLAIGHPSLIKNMRMPREGEKRYNLPSLKRLADVLDLEFYFGPKRPIPITAASSQNNADPDDQAPAGFVIIPWAEQGARVGSAPVAFSRHWVADHNLTPDFLQAAIPDVISLPGPHPADTVALIDSRIGIRKGHNLWCFRHAGQSRVAHITFTDQLAVIHPTDAGQPPTIIEEPVTRELRLLGKVVWLGQSVPFKGRIG